MDKIRIVLANDPRSYREIMAEAIRSVRPHVEVLVSEPESLTDLIESLSPDLVICSRLTAAIQNGVRSWVQFYPDGERRVVTSIDGRLSTLVDVELSELLSLIDAAGS